jgi:hypothetical protein
MKTIETKIIINASTDKVWDTLMDFENYPTWNPFIKSISGDQKTGSNLVVSIHPPGASAMTFKPKILVNEFNKEFRWKGKLLITGIFDGEHYFILSSNGPDTTEFTQGEKFSGILVGIFGSILEKTKSGFELMNKALKEKCEEI